MTRKAKALTKVSPVFYDINAERVIALIRIAQENANTYGEPFAIYQTNAKKRLRTVAYHSGKWKGQELLEIVHPSSEALKRFNTELVA